MGRVIEGSQLSKTPQVKFTRDGAADAPAGAYIVGQLVAAREIDKYSTVFEFLLEDAHEATPILLRNEDKTWKDATVGAGSKVSVFGSTNKEGSKNQLMDKLSQVVIGERAKITFNGKKPSKQGRAYNDFTVEVL